LAEGLYKPFGKGRLYKVKRGKGDMGDKLGLERRKKLLTFGKDGASSVLVLPKEWCKALSFGDEVTLRLIPPRKGIGHIRIEKAV
jgi:hypothetical protein